MLSIKLVPLAYAYLYESFRKIPYPDFIDALSTLVFLPPLFISEFTGATWLMRSSYEPSKIGIALSCALWLIVDASVASLVTFLFL